ncbi:unnamed protein product [Anisakis simplex]|uniref:Zinc finger protein n=1 Tax=Anisakis simplex TaxID=6269 RepID=A0A0M3K4K5_ANISI|nr:unnamed protein product [Anisakis simplex]
MKVDGTTEDLRTCEWEDCEWSGSAIDALSDHISEKHLIKGDNKCYWRNCSRQCLPFRYRYQLQRHLRMHTNQQPFSCTMCAASFASNERLTLHNRVCHQKLRFVKCKFCLKTFGTCSDRRNHELRAHHKRRVQCHLCAAVLSSASALRKHSLRFHPNH